MEKSIHTAEYRQLLDWLIEVRRSKALTQRDLAAELQVPPSFVAKIELGERRLDVLEYVRYCRALGADPHEGIREIEKRLK